MITGKKPFAADSVGQLLEMHVKERPPDPRRHRPELPEYVCQVIGRCLAKSPGRRYANAWELREELERLVDR
jgi:serine/threonine-protein kinase